MTNYSCLLFLQCSFAVSIIGIFQILHDHAASKQPFSCSMSNCSVHLVLFFSPSKSFSSLPSSNQVSFAEKGELSMGFFVVVGVFCLLFFWAFLFGLGFLVDWFCLFVYWFCF